MTYLQVASLLKLCHIALTLERATSSQKHVFVVAIDVLCPRGEPSHCRIVNYLLPLAGDIRFWDGDAFADVNCDVLRVDAILSMSKSDEFFEILQINCLRPSMIPSLDARHDL